jgi:transposase InsO family protein
LSSDKCKVERRGRVRRRAQGTPLSLGQTLNELWCTDYKGEFLLGNQHYCFPLTVTDHASRFLLTCEALSSTQEDYAFAVFERLFRERGLPANIRSDNGNSSIDSSYHDDGLHLNAKGAQLFTSALADALREPIQRTFAVANQSTQLVEPTSLDHSASAQRPVARLPRSDQDTGDEHTAVERFGH